MRRPAAGAKRETRRSAELRLLEVLRDRRLSVLLLRRHLDFLPAGHRTLAHHLDRHLPQPGRRPRLHRVVQRLLRQNSCGNCECNRNEREKPMYRPSRNNDLNWCMANADSNYHCSVSVILGVAEKK